MSFWSDGQLHALDFSGQWPTDTDLFELSNGIGFSMILIFSPSPAAELQLRKSVPSISTNCLVLVIIADFSAVDSRETILWQRKSASLELRYYNPAARRRAACNQLDENIGARSHGLQSRHS